MSIKSIEKYFKTALLSNSLGHAYLFSNVSYEEINEILLSIIQKYIFNTKEDLKNNPDFYIVEPEKEIIKKDQIFKLRQEIIKTSQNNNTKVYIIKECDKLNSSAANSLLKTLEEPGQNVYAFLLACNVENVFKTIKSRCQIIYCNNFKKTIFDKEIIDRSIIFIKKYEKNGIKSIAYANKNFYIFGKNDLKKILSVVEYFYKDCINKINNVELEYLSEYDEVLEYIINKNDEKQIINKIIIISKNLNLLNYNLNLNLFMDKLLIELGRV